MRKGQASAGKNGKQKGQAAVELMVVLAVSVAVLIAIYSYSATSMGEMNKQKIVDEAQVSVNSLEQAANDVYRQGVGATKKVFYKVPSGIDQTKSGIESDTFVLNILGTDVYAKPDICLQGSLSTEQGGHWVWVTAQEECVFVGTQNIAVDKTSSYVTLDQSDSQDDIITVTNNGSETAAVFLAESWTHTDVTFGMSTSEFSLAADASQPITLTYTSNASATGNYAGSLGIGASFPSSSDQNILLPLNAEVQVASGGGGSLAVFPAAHVKGMAPSDIDNNSFQVCNNSDSDIATVSFSDSGDIASWIDAISDISNLLIGECRNVNYTLTVPGGQASGNYTGNITATDGTDSDSLAITVVVPAVGDVDLPVVALDVPADNDTSSSYDVQFDYSVTDATSGIASCELIIDGASDQTDNTITEGITQSFSKTFASNGTYYWDVNCTDNSANANEGTSGENRAIIINVVAGPTYAMFAPTAGTDTTDGSYSLDAADLSDVSASDNSDYQSQGNWPKQDAGYNEAMYVEYEFNPGVPGGATLSDVNVTHEFATGNPSRAIYAKLEIWDGSTWTDEVLMSNQNSNSSDVTHTVNVGSYIDTVAEVNTIRVRFLMYVVPNTNKDSEEDLVRVGVTYTT